MQVMVIVFETIETLKLPFLFRYLDLPNAGTKDWIALWY